MRNLRNLRNVAIIMLLAVPVAFAPHGDNAAEAVLAAISMGFLAGISWMLYTLSRQNQLTLATLSDGRRAILYGAFGLLALLVAGTDRMFSTGGGTLLWILLLAAAVAAIWRIWTEANTY
ncbi:MAG TPA: hypothetical protein VFJ57_10625 [Solirubrobacterales bacterium]|nr:hypothetical protein [Solirubrobacterales bacterium]